MRISAQVTLHPSAVSAVSLNIIFVLIIITDAYGFECIKYTGVKGTKLRPSSGVLSSWSRI